jgi:hypothetical protein
LRSLALAAVVAAAGCSTDPVHDAEVAALGPEVPGMPKSLFEYHRAGQPCLVCHGGEGPAHSQFSFGGTVFAGPFECNSTNNTTGVNNVYVGIVDSAGGHEGMTSNCVGNFYMPANSSSDYPAFPAYPVDVGVTPPDGVTLPMPTHIGRNGSCAFCHADPTGPAALGHVYVPAPADAGAMECPVSPIAPSASCPPDAGSL